MRRKSGPQLYFPVLKPYLHSKFRTEHGGEIRVGKRKLARPFDPKRPLHLVMRSSRARNSWSLLKRENSRTVVNLTRRIASRYNVRIYQYANSGNHLHFLVRAKTKVEFQNFLRVLAGAIAQAITHAKKGYAIGKFWNLLAYSRLLTWGREFRSIRRYVIQNELEGLGVLPTRPSGKKPKPSQLMPIF